MSENRLSACTPGPYENDDGTIHANGAGIATVATLDDFPCIDHSDNEGCMAIERECAANADLLALAYDHALLLAAMQADVAGFHVMDCTILLVDVDGEVAPRRFKFNLTPFGTPLLTSELRQALRRAVGVEG